MFTAFAKGFDASSEFIHTKIGRVNSMNNSSIDMYEKRLVISYRLKFIHRIKTVLFDLLFEISKYITIPDMCRNDFILKSLVDDEVGTGN